VGGSIESEATVKDALSTNSMNVSRDLRAR
jgi:hypothetical protein